MKKEINREKAVELITDVIYEKMEKGELSDDFYEWQDLDYEVPEEFDKAQEIQERFQYYDKVAFDLECGNELTDEQIDEFYLNLKGRREWRIESSIDSLRAEIKVIDDEVFWLKKSAESPIAHELHSVWCSKEILKFEAKKDNLNETIKLLEKYKETL